MHSCKRETDAPRSKTFIHFYTNVCPAGVQCYFKFTETTDKGNIIVRNLHTRWCKQELMRLSFFSLSLQKRIPQLSICVLFLFILKMFIIFLHMYFTFFYKLCFQYSYDTLIWKMHTKLCKADSSLISSSGNRVLSFFF